MPPRHLEYCKADFPRACISQIMNSSNIEIRWPSTHSKKVLHLWLVGHIGWRWPAGSCSKLCQPSWETELWQETEKDEAAEEKDGRGNGWPFPKNWKSKRLKGRNEHWTSSKNGLKISTESRVHTDVGIQLQRCIQCHPGKDEEAEEEEEEECLIPRWRRWWWNAAQWPRQSQTTGLKKAVLDKALWPPGARFADPEAEASIWVFKLWFG